MNPVGIEIFVPETKIREVVTDQGDQSGHRHRNVGGRAIGDRTINLTIG